MLTIGSDGKEVHAGEAWREVKTTRVLDESEGREYETTWTDTTPDWIQSYQETRNFSRGVKTTTTRIVTSEVSLNEDGSQTDVSTTESGNTTEEPLIRREITRTDELDNFANPPTSTGSRPG